MKAFHSVKALHSAEVLHLVKALDLVKAGVFPSKQALHSMNAGISPLRQALRSVKALRSATTLYSAGVSFAESRRSIDVKAFLSAK